MPFSYRSPLSALRSCEKRMQFHLQPKAKYDACCWNSKKLSYFSSCWSYILVFVLLLCFSLGYFFQFEQENKKLYEELNALSDEVKWVGWLVLPNESCQVCSSHLLCCRNIEGRVIEISQLQKVFTEKVLEQVSRFTYSTIGFTDKEL